MDSTSQPVPVQTVCGGMLREPEKYPNILYQGQRLYFCTLACLRVFNENPAAFLSGEVEHPADEL